MSHPFAAETARCRAAHAKWAAVPFAERLRPIREFRHLLADDPTPLTDAIAADVNRPADEVIATDFLPTAETCRFLVRNAVGVLRPRRPGGRPLWLFGCRDTIHRRPHGVVGLIGTWNYPLYLNAVPILHALAAGNGVVWKPSEQTPRFAPVLHALFARAGFPPDLVTLLPATREAGPLLAEAEVNFVHFTGSESVGRRLAAKLGERLIPSVLELSGVDAVVVLPDADVKLAARSAWYGATMNAGQTCMATRRVFVQREVYPKFVAELRPLVEAAPAMRLQTRGQVEQTDRLVRQAVTAEAIAGKHLPADDHTVRPTALLGVDPLDAALFREVSFAPVLGVTPFDTPDEAVSLHNACAFGLAAGVFTGDASAGAELAGRLRCGAVVVNDVIVPTAHPGTPFGGRGASGWGSTQGEDGLLQMTVPQVVTVRAGKFRPHVDAGLGENPGFGDVSRGLLAFGHGRTLGERWRGFRRLVRGALAGKKPTSPAATNPG